MPSVTGSLIEPTVIREALLELERQASPVYSDTVHRVDEHLAAQVEKAAPMHDLVHREYFSGWLPLDEWLHNLQVGLQSQVVFLVSYLLTIAVLTLLLGP